jgi:hypothetical protein
MPVRVYSTRTTICEEILLKAIAQAGQKPKILRTDGALEYLDMGGAATLRQLGIFKQTTNPNQQFGDGKVHAYKKLFCVKMYKCMYVHV